MLKQLAALVGAGVQFIALLALNDGAPVYDHQIAAILAQFGICAFACTLNQFSDLMAAAISRVVRIFLNGQQLVIISRFVS